VSTDPYLIWSFEGKEETMPSSYHDVARALRERISGGEWSAEESLPTVIALMKEYDTSRDTVRNAIAQLAREGLVRVVKKAGTIVQPTTERRRIKRSQTVSRNALTGYVFPAASSPGEQWTVHGQPRKSVISAPAAVTDQFDLPAGTDVLRRRRVTSPVGEPPFQIVDTWLSPEAVADAPQVAEDSTGPGGYLDRLEEAGHGPISWREATQARMPTSEEALLLRISMAMPVMEMTLVGRSGLHGRPIEVTVRVIPADRVELVSELHRDEAAAWPREGEAQQ
jgi:GntR family transcriptional regulator